LETEGEMKVQIVGLKGVPPEHLVFECFDAEGRDVKFPEQGAADADGGKPRGGGGRH
jgi:hypothetical protein